MKSSLKAACAVLMLCLCACDSGYAPNVIYTDPFTGEQQQVYAEYLAIHYYPLDKPWNRPGLHELPPAVLDTQMTEYNAWRYGGFRSDPKLQDFITAEEVKVVNWWDGPTSRSPGLTVALPNGSALEDAVARWSTEYADLFSGIHPIPLSTYDPAYVAP